MPWSVGIRLAHAALQVLADDGGFDLLHIKGPAVDDSLLETRPGRPDGEGGPAAIVVPRSSLDADVLVRPSHVDRLFAAMHAHGWVTKVQFEDGSAFEHAATMGHPFLAPVDVHRRFPGIGADPEAVFERLWAERRAAPIGGYPCWVPSVPAQRLVLILHAVRGGDLGGTDIRVAWHEAEPAQRAEVEALAAELDAEVALAAATGRLEQYTDRREYALWRLLSGRRGSRLDLWVARVRAEPTASARVRLAIKLVLPNPRRLQFALGRRPTWRELVRAYAVRARQGLRELRGLQRGRGGS